MRVEPIAEHHREGLREAAEREPQIHRYTGMYSLGFDRWFDEALGSETEVPFVVLVDGRPVGSTRYMNIEPFHRRAEIGWTWLERAAMGNRCEHRDEVPPPPKGLRGLGCDARRVQDRR